MREYFVPVVVFAVVIVVLFHLVDLVSKSSGNNFLEREGDESDSLRGIQSEISDFKIQNSLEKYFKGKSGIDLFFLCVAISMFIFPPSIEIRYGKEFFSGWSWLWEIGRDENTYLNVGRKIDFPILLVQWALLFLTYIFIRSRKG